MAWASRRRSRCGSGRGRRWLATLLAALLARPAPAIVWNGPDHPERGVTSSTGLTDRPGLWANVHTIWNQTNNTRGTATYLANNWLITARHNLQASSYSTLANPSTVYFDVGGRRYFAEEFVTMPSSADQALVRIAGSTGLTELPSTLIYSGNTDRNTRLVQMGGYGGHGWIGATDLSYSVRFHRGWNTTFANGPNVSTRTNGEQRLRDLGLLEVGGISGDSGSPLFMLDGPDSALDDWSLYRLIGTLATVSVPMQAWGATSNYVRTTVNSGLIRQTVWGPLNVVYSFQVSSGDFAEAANWNADQGGASFPFQATRYQIDNGGTATFSATSAGGRLSLAAEAELRIGGTASGSLTITGGTLAAGAGVIAGRAGQGVVHLRGGTLTARQLVAGAAAGSSGGVTVVSGTAALAESLIVGQAGAGSLIQSGGLVSVELPTSAAPGGPAVIGLLAGSSGTYSLSGGRLEISAGSAAASGTATGTLVVGAAGHGVLAVSQSGSVTVPSLVVGRSAGGSGELRQTGGTLAIMGDPLVIGDSGTGALVLAGGRLDAAAGVVVGRGPGGVGTVTISGGTLATGGIRGLSPSATSHLTISGGLLVATADSGDFLGGLTSATLSGAGLLLDTAGHEVAILQPLSVPDAVDAASGAVVDAVAGGLTKRGAGTLRLAAANDFAGPTRVEQGVLALVVESALAGSPWVKLADGAVLDVSALEGYAVPSGQSLGGTGTVAGSVTFGAGATLSPGGSFGMAAVLPAAVPEPATALPSLGGLTLLLLAASGRRSTTRPRRLEPPRPGVVSTTVLSAHSSPQATAGCIPHSGSEAQLGSTIAQVGSAAQQVGSHGSSRYTGFRTQRVTV